VFPIEIEYFEAFLGTELVLCCAERLDTRKEFSLPQFCVCGGIALQVWIDWSEAAKDMGIVSSMGI
jgi:hypothetical protein